MEKRFEELLSKALRIKASDVHFKYVDNQLAIEMRGLSGIVKIPTLKDDVKLFNYLQYKSHLDITSTNPQSGSFSYYYKGTFYDFRLSTICYGTIKDGVLRILNYHSGISVDKLTYDRNITNLLRYLINRRSGLLLFSGLTGSGKTTTIYSLLKSVQGKSIYSLEDPIEVNIDNIVQLSINENIGFSYNEGIKQILRHNPDILMIGEIRDEKTAKMAIRAALTGCLVVSCIHGKSSTGALRRLLELDVNPLDVRDIVLAIFNQRLCKRVDGNGYECIYDYIDNKKINDYLDGKTVTDNMKDNLLKAVENGIIEPLEDYD